MAVERCCCACRTRRDKRRLIRFARSAPGRVEMDPAATARGRGAYVCPKVGCMDLALQRGGLARALRAAIPPEQAAALRKRFVGYVGVDNAEHQGS